MPACGGRAGCSAAEPSAAQPQQQHRQLAALDRPGRGSGPAPPSRGCRRCAARRRPSGPGRSAATPRVRRLTSRRISASRRSISSAQRVDLVLGGDVVLGRGLFGAHGHVSSSVPVPGPGRARAPGPLDTGARGGWSAGGHGHRGPVPVEESAAISSTSAVCHTAGLSGSGGTLSNTMSALFELPQETVTEPRTARGAGPAGGSQPAPARGGRARGVAAADRRGRGVGQDQGAHPPHRLAAGRARRAPRRDHVDHLHQQGRGRDEGAGRRAGRAPRQRDVGVHVPLDVRAHPAARGVSTWACAARSPSTTPTTRAG